MPKAFVDLLRAMMRGSEDKAAERVFLGNLEDGENKQTTDLALLEMAMLFVKSEALLAEAELMRAWVSGLPIRRRNGVDYVLVYDVFAKLLCETDAILRVASLGHVLDVIGKAVTSVSVSGVRERR